MKELGINLGFLVFQILNFTILVILLYAWAYKPIIKALENRKKKIAQAYEDARVAADARENAEKDAAKIVAEAQTKAGQTVREATERAEQAAKDVREAAELEAGKAREAALAGVEEERTRMLADLRGQVAALAISATQKLVGEALDEKRQHALLEEFFSGIQSGKVALLADSKFQGASADVISALPLYEQEQTIIKKDILAKTGAQAVTFRVDPSILGGLVIKVGDKVMDGSVSGKLEGLRGNLR